MALAMLLFRKKSMGPCRDCPSKHARQICSP